jgi:hypothetical protein
MNLFVSVFYMLVGIILVGWAAPLSLRYNAWTTGFRERHPNINPPPTPEWRARNTKIMTVLFRIFGIWLVILSILHFAPLLDPTKPH